MYLKSTPEKNVIAIGKTCLEDSLESWWHDSKSSLFPSAHRLFPVSYSAFVSTSKLRNLKETLASHDHIFTLVVS